ncbi:hypothetical protein [Roseospira visakhapatnamensis]|uniref:Uncharacterized protein n=1 Tax=Roseospira visakhapatnamensis TaxID=390880 RepID=A0A7W6RAH6_9PROT|nr:hypothetical protein [Roseospira visakhapatnamensis]MBB4264892.1 hypothetical protein [Roseospira visakhapatnamensis]
MFRCHRRLPKTLTLAATLALASAPALAQQGDAIRQIDGTGPATVVFECTHPTAQPAHVEFNLRRMGGQIWTYSNFERAVDCASLSTGGITCMATEARGRGQTLQGTLNNLLRDEQVRCTRVR